MRSSRRGSQAPSIAGSSASFAIAPGLSGLAAQKRKLDEQKIREAVQAKERENVEAILEKERMEREAFERKQAEIMQKAAEDETRAKLIDAAKAIEKDTPQARPEDPAPEHEAEIERETSPRMEIDLDPASQDEPVVVTVMSLLNFLFL